MHAMDGGVAKTLTALGANGQKPLDDANDMHRLRDDLMENVDDLDFGTMEAAMAMKTKGSLKEGIGASILWSVKSMNNKRNDAPQWHSRMGCTAGRQEGMS